MDKQEIRSYSLKISEALEQKRLKTAFELLSFLPAHTKNWQLKEELGNLEDNYKMMLSYLTEGIEDPEREKIYNGLLRSVYKIADQAILQVKITHSKSFYYGNKKIRTYDTLETSSQLIEIWNNVINKFTLVELLAGEEKNINLQSLEKEKENIEIKIFHTIWLSGLWNSDEQKRWSEFLNNKLNPNSILCLIISALTLNLEEMFDEKKAELLLDATESENEEVYQRALTGILLFLRRYDKRLFLYRKITNRLQLLSENKRFVNNMRNILLQFILSLETEKVTRIIKEEIIPEMMKIGPKIGTKIKLDDLMNDAGFEDKNPEWQKLLDESGLTEKLQQFTELQMEGVDVMLSSFIHLKNYPFFNEISNWFMPFTLQTDRAEIQEVSGLIKALLDSPVLCNSDKYSFYYSILQMPDDYRKLMISQFSSESSAMQEMMKGDLPNNTGKIHPAARQYIQDVYRFYKLHPKHNDLEDIFEIKPDFYQVPSINLFISDKESQTIIGEYYFNRNHFCEAIDIFDSLLEKNPNNEIFLEKKAYALQMQGDLEEALNNYLKAELFNPNNSWTIKKIANCYRALKQAKEALTYYRKAEQLNPDNLSILLNIGHCHLELKNYSEALKCYFKVEYLTKNKEKAWRPIAWCSFLIGKYEQAADYFDKIMNCDPYDVDYLNAGHTQLVLGRTKEALRLYRLALHFSDNSLEKFMEAFTADLPDLLNAGIKEKEIPFILDSLIYCMY